MGPSFLRSLCPSHPASGHWGQCHVMVKNLGSGAACWGVSIVTRLWDPRDVCVGEVTLSAVQLLCRLSEMTHIEPHTGNPQQMEAAVTPDV